MTALVPRAPGLYLQAVDSDPAVVAESAVTAFVGVAERGPLDSPQIVRNWGEYVEVFGGPWGFGVMAESVYGFFQNGGTSACAVRVAHELAAAAASPCPLQEDLGTAKSAPIADANANETLKLEAKSPGRWGNGLVVEVRADASREQDLAALSVSASSGASQIIVDFVHDFRAGGEIRLTHLDNAFASSRHGVTAIDEGLRRLSVAPPLPREYPVGSRVLGRGFAVEVLDGERREVFDNLSMNPAHARHFVEVINGAAGLKELEARRLGHSLLIRSQQVFGLGGVSRFKPVNSPAAGLAFGGGGDGITLARATLLDATTAPALRATAKPRGRAGNEVTVRSEPFVGRIAIAVPEPPSAVKDRIVVEDVRGWVAGDTLRITHLTNGALTETALVVSVDEATHLVLLGAPLTNDYPLFSPVEIAGRFNLHFDVQGSPAASESFFNMSIAAGPRFAPDIVNGVADPLVFSQLACIHTVPPATGAPVGQVALAGGQDPGEMEISRYTGYLADDTLFLPGGPAQGPVGLAALEGVVEVNLVTIPDLAALPLEFTSLLLAQRQLLHHCQKLGERFALLDPPLGMSPLEASEWPGELQDGKLPRFGAAYFPWLSVVVEDQTRLLPPSGVVAGLIAQADATSGVGRAPANIACKGVVGLERDIDASDQGELNVRGVNCVRKFEEGAVRLYGARTLSGETPHLYVNNRRLVAAVVKALSRNLLWAVFEPNDDKLRRRIRDSLEGYFQGLLFKGLTAGNSKDEAYYVKVGGDLETEATRGAGELLAEVGLALSQPAEFIVIAVKRRPEIMALVEEET